MKKTVFILILISNLSFSQTTLDSYSEKYVKNKNGEVLSYIKTFGRTLSPDYDKVNCSDFLIKVLSKYYKLTVRDLQKISIFITDKNDAYNFSVYIQNLNDTSNFYNGNAKFINNHNLSSCCGMADMKSIYTKLSKGVVQWIVDSKNGIEIDFKNGMIPMEGDIVQFWKINSYGHCGILKSIDTKNKTITLYSSFPSTKGYGVQEFVLPEYLYIGRLK